MFTMGRKQSKIFDSVIIFNPIDMMHNFISRQVASKMLFHNQSGLAYIQSSSSDPIFSSKWMIRFVNKYVTFAYSLTIRKFRFCKIIFMRLRKFYSFFCYSKIHYMFIGQLSSSKRFSHFLDMFFGFFSSFPVWRNLAFSNSRTFLRTAYNSFELRRRYIKDSTTNFTINFHNKSIAY